MPKGLSAIFNPRSIAIIGTSRKKGSLGREILHNLVTYGFQGPVYPINPYADYVHSIKCYPSVLKVPGPVDLAIIVIPAGGVLKVIKQCVKKSVKGIIIITAGFKETGKKGAELEQTIVDTIKSHGIRLIGPNCMGVINTSTTTRMDATFAAVMPRRGGISFISQSGALGNIILEYAHELNLGFSKFVSMGNKADVSGNDLLEYFEKDDNTKMILMYLESFGNPRKFTAIARRLTRSKPIIAVKAGRTFAGARAARSHTGALSGLDMGTKALFDQCGVLRATSIEELFDYAMAFENQPLPKGNKVAILTNAGGPAILATDAIVSLGMEMSTFSGKTKKILRRNLPKAASIANPVDILGDSDPEHYQIALDTILNDPNVDGVITMFVPPLITDPLEIAKSITKASRKYTKPVLGCFLGREDVLASVEELEKHNVPAYQFPESAAKALAAMYKFKTNRDRKAGKVKTFKDVKKNQVKKVIEKVKSKGRTLLCDVEVEQVLKAYGFEFPPSKLVKNEDSAVRAANEIGFPIVLKIVSTDIFHKTDIGGVVLDIKSELELRGGYNKIMKELDKGIKKGKVKKSGIQGVLVQKMVKGGQETVLGMASDPSFGPLLMFGLGGIYVEILKDVNFKIHPLSDLDAAEMIKSIKSYPLLAGARGEKPVDIEAIEEYLLRLSQLIGDFHDIEELDINPLRVFEKGKVPMVLDAKIKLAE
jgi:acetyltransferase